MKAPPAVMPVINLSIVPSIIPSCRYGISIKMPGQVGPQHLGEILFYDPPHRGDTFNLVRGYDAKGDMEIFSFLIEKICRYGEFVEDMGGSITAKAGWGLRGYITADCIGLVNEPRPFPYYEGPGFH